MTTPRRGGVTTPRRGGVTTPRRGGVTTPRRGGVTIPRRGGVTTPRRGGVTLLYCWVLILASGCTNAVDVDAVLMSGALLAYRQGCHHSYDIAGSIVRPAGGVVPIVISAPDKPVSRLIVTSVQKLPQLFVDTISENIYIVSGGF